MELFHLCWAQCSSTSRTIFSIIHMINNAIYSTDVTVKEMSCLFHIDLQLVDDLPTLFFTELNRIAKMDK